jgi:hypothetical protein
VSKTIIAAAAIGSGAAPARDRARMTPPSSGHRGAGGSMPRPGSHVIVLFGATGDLARRMLLPGLFHLDARHLRGVGSPS